MKNVFVSEIIWSIIFPILFLSVANLFWRHPHKIYIFGLKGTPCKVMRGLFLLLFIIPVIFMYSSTRTYQFFADIPSFVEGNYEIVEGIPELVDASTFSTDHHVVETFLVNGKKVLLFDDMVVPEQVYTLKVLPHSGLTMYISTK